MDQNSIFITQDECTENKLVTFTNIVDNLPKGCTIIKDNKWKNKKKIKWRWRFMKFDNKSIVEISYKYPNDNRIYFNKQGNWVHRQVPKIYNQFVEKIVYYYVDL